MFYYWQIKFVIENEMQMFSLKLKKHGVIFTHQVSMVYSPGVVAEGTLYFSF